LYILGNTNASFILEGEYGRYVKHFNN